MLFNSLQFLIYFPTVVLLYFLLPFKLRWVWLLGASYFFYMNWNPKYAILMATSTLITYISGVLIEKSDQLKDEEKKKKQKKLWVTLSFSINLLILFFFKYFNFINENMMHIFSKLNIGINIPNFDILLPVGISFYTFQALSYTMDVYRGEIKAQKNLGKYALFVSFFPQLVAGPIERSTNLLTQLEGNYKFNYERVKNGLLLMLWGFFKKVVIADRLAISVNKIYNDPTNYEGLTLIIATILFAFQIYCDFSSYSDIAIGAANVMGYNLMKNFERPYFSKSIAEFWRRWHISLGTWFRDYLYFPIGGSKVSKSKKYRNIMTVFLVSGLWHGASWNFIIWGALHGTYQLVGMELKPLRDKFVKVCKIDRNSFFVKIYKISITFILVDFAWIFFRANSFSDALYIITNLFSGISLTFYSFNKVFENFAITKKEFLFIPTIIIILESVHILQRKLKIIDWINKQKFYIRWGIYYFLIFTIIIFGSYGNIETSEFIYFQF